MASFGKSVLKRLRGATNDPWIEASARTYNTPDSPVSKSRNASRWKDGGICEDGVVNFVCEDLPQHGLVLVPPGSEKYDGLLADIENRMNAPVDGSPPYPERFRPRIVAEDRPISAILLNRSAKSIVGLWAVWRFETEEGRSFHHSIGMLSPQMTLLPFDKRPESHWKLHIYRHTILPGSKRYLGQSGIVGDNTDVRLPDEDEKWRGGMGGGRGGGRRSSLDPIRQVTLMLDGVFFADGEFAGPDEGKMFEQTVADAEAHRTVARIAQEAHDRGLSAAEILAEIEKTTGVVGDRPPIPLHFRNPAATHDDFVKALEMIAYHLGARWRFPQAPTEDQTVLRVLSWNDALLPTFRKV